ncbi:MAG: SDR family NAD(P)-dependent oxidoreductase [Caldilineaceae bacterium]
MMNALKFFDLTGRVALVTGAGRGIGQAMTLALADAGADIACLYNTRYEATAALVQERGRRFMPDQLDLTTATPEALKRVVQQVVAELGRIDILVNNAGIIRRTKAVDYSVEDWETVLQVNLNSVFHLSQARHGRCCNRRSNRAIAAKLFRWHRSSHFRGDSRSSLHGGKACAYRDDQGAGQ